MARTPCGCGGSCSCVVEGIPPITVNGNGSTQQTYKVGLSVNGKDGCAAIVACLAGNLGPGLIYDDGSGKLQVRLSGDAGNTARFGSDTGVLVPAGGTPPPPVVCQQTIEDLPAAPNLVGAAYLAQLRGPYSSPFQVDWCLATGCDIISFRCATSSDDVGVVSDLDTHRLDENRTSIYIGQEIRQLSAEQCASTYNYAGDLNDPRSHALPEGGDRTQRGGGWYGWLAQPYYTQLLTDALSRISAKAVALVDCSPAAEVPYPESTAIIGAVRGVLQLCAQPWVFIGVSEIANATTVKNAGITPVMLPATPAAYGTATLPYEVADLQAAGITWIVLDHRYADTVFTTYRDAGLQVLMYVTSRHVDRARVGVLGIRGAMAGDPVYYRGAVTDVWPYGYRTETDPWEHRKLSTGQLTARTDVHAVVSDSGLVRGRCTGIEQGLILPAGFGNTLARPSVLCGWQCPMANTDAYTITWDMKWNTLATVSSTRAKMGLLFGAATDADTLGWPEGDPDVNPSAAPPGQQTMYRVFQRQNGEIGIAKWASQTAEITYLTTIPTPAVAADVFNSYELIVSPTLIRFTRILSDDTRFTITSADTQYRGAYFFVEKEEGAYGDTANPFEGMVRNMTYTAG